jgi:hypothetical protein
MEFKYKRFKEEFNYLEVLLPEDEWHFQEFEVDGETSEGLDALFEKYPQILQDNGYGKYLKLIIELETGHVVNWPTEYGGFDFHDAKIVDTGIYTLMKTTKQGDDDLGYEGYVPTCIGEGGYGDYLEFEIDGNGNIPGWNFDGADYREFLREQDFDEDEDD